MSLSLTQALRINSSSCVAFVGAGGKTTAMFKLARELPMPVIVTATTHLGAWQTELADKHIATDAAFLDESDMDFQGITLITGTLDGDRTKPVSDDLLKWLHHYCADQSIPLLIEADGSRQKPLKAWADHEPPIPDFVKLVVQVAGLSGLGKPLTDEHVHRAEMFSRLGGLKIGEIVTAKLLVQVLSHHEGGLKNIPQNAKRIVFLNQADDAETQSIAQTMTTPLLSVYQSVVIASLLKEQIYAVHEPIAGIILAAGESRRFGGAPKQTLDWKGQPFVRVVAMTALEAGLSPVVVVTGANAELVESTISDLNVKVVRNNEWKEGQGSSIKAGVQSIIQPPSSRRAEGVGGAIFLLADQPQVGTSILHALKEKHAGGLYPIIAPMVMDQRANPVLFDRAVFSDLMSIEGDTGGRAIFHKHRVEYLPWHDDGLLLDVDTLKDYQRLISSNDL